MTATDQQSILSTIIVGVYRTPSEWLTDILLQLSPIFSKCSSNDTDESESEESGNEISNNELDDMSSGDEL